MEFMPCAFCRIYMKKCKSDRVGFYSLGSISSNAHPKPAPRIERAELNIWGTGEKYVKLKSSFRQVAMFCWPTVSSFNHPYFLGFWVRI